MARPEELLELRPRLERVPDIAERPRLSRIVTVSDPEVPDGRAPLSDDHLVAIERDESPSRGDPGIGKGPDPGGRLGADLRVVPVAHPPPISLDHRRE